MAQDGDGQPVVVCGEQLLRWTGTDWQSEPFPPADVEIEVFTRDALVREDQIWSLALPPGDAERVLFNLDAGSGAWRTLPVPGADDQDEPRRVSFELLAGGSLLVLAGGEEQHFYLLQDGVWQEPPLTIETRPSTAVRHFAMDPAGDIWVLLMDDDWRWNVGWLDRTANAWTWYDLPEGSEAADESCSELLVDARGRVWLVCSQWSPYRKRLRVFRPDPAGSLQEIVHYTEDNSNYQEGYNAPSQGSDGRIWSADRKLVWIDGGSPDLPLPLPDWAPWVITSREMRLGAACCPILLFGIGVLALARYRRRWDQEQAQGAGS